VCPSHSAGGLNQINRAKSIQMNLNLHQTCPRFIFSKQALLSIENFDIKYGLDGFEERNNLLHRKFFRFGMDFEIKKLETQGLFLTLGV
jgi:hypothetical protein